MKCIYWFRFYLYFMSAYLAILHLPFCLLLFKSFHFCFFWVFLCFVSLSVSDLKKLNICCLSCKTYWCGSYVFLVSRFYIDKIVGFAVWFLLHSYFGVLYSLLFDVSQCVISKTWCEKCSVLMIYLCKLFIHYNLDGELSHWHSYQIFFLISSILLFY